MSLLIVGHNPDSNVHKMQASWTPSIFSVCNNKPHQSNQLHESGEYPWLDGSGTQSASDAERQLFSSVKRAATVDLAAPKLPAIFDPELPKDAVPRLLFTAIALLPIYGISPCARFSEARRVRPKQEHHFLWTQVFLLIFLIIDKTDEFQLVSFILQFKDSGVTLELCAP